MLAGYRSDGLRAWKESGGIRTYYLYVGTKLLAEVGADGTVKSWNTWGPTGLLGRSTVVNGRQQDRWYAFDPLGNVALRLNGDGTPMVNADGTADQYDAWGNILWTTDATDPYGYKGQFGYYHDTETGFYLCTFRYYDPVAGRWLTQDPIGYAGGLNLYGYCGNGPVMSVDGLGWCKNPGIWVNFCSWFGGHKGAFDDYLANPVDWEVAGDVCDAACDATISIVTLQPLIAAADRWGNMAGTLDGMGWTLDNMALVKERSDDEQIHPFIQGFNIVDASDDPERFASVSLNIGLAGYAVADLAIPNATVTRWCTAEEVAAGTIGKGKFVILGKPTAFNYLMSGGLPPAFDCLRPYLDWAKPKYRDRLCISFVMCYRQRYT